MCSKDMPYRPGTMKKGPNDARRVVWALDKFCFSYFSIYNRLFTKYIYIFLFFVNGPGSTLV